MNAILTERERSDLAYRAPEQVDAFGLISRYELTVRAVEAERDRYRNALVGIRVFTTYQPHDEAQMRRAIQEDVDAALAGSAVTG